MNKITLSNDQKQALNEVLAWYKNPDKDQLLTLGGYAGTGKSTILAFLREELGEDTRVAFVSLTGKAVSVMSKKLVPAKVVGYWDVISTMHSFMYIPIIGEDGQIKGWTKREMAEEEEEGDPSLIPPTDLIINDEASMTSEVLYNDLASYDVPILAVGDHGQLPPINSKLNLMESPQVCLEKIHRQAEDNPILSLATNARLGIPIKVGTYSDKVKKFSLEEGFSDDRVDYLLANPSKESILLTPYNKTRVFINKQIRYTLQREGDPFPGDRVICLRNDRNLGLYNGLLGEVLSCKEMDSLNYSMNIQEDEGREIKNLKVSKHCFNVEKPENPKGVFWKDIGTRWDYAYAVTCHKAQGSESKSVIVKGEWRGENSARWLYTAITRAQEELYLID